MQSNIATKSRQGKINYCNFNTKRFKTIAKLFATYLLSGECLNGRKQKKKKGLQVDTLISFLISCLANNCYHPLYVSINEWICTNENLF